MATSEVTRRDIIDHLIASGKVFSGRLDEIEFLERIWNLKSLPSTDSRFRNAREDIHQHRINNSDWDDHELLYDHLDLLYCDDDIFFRFLENCLHPIVVISDAHRIELQKAFNDLLSKDNFVLRQIDDISGRPVFKVMPRREGVQGKVKNLIFAANGPKPELVLVDSVSNDIRIVKNEEYCLVYDKPIGEHGVLWKDLIDWWKESQHMKTHQSTEHDRSLAGRLQKSLSSPPERLLFETYYRHFGTQLKERLPALIPQVYLHYDPKLIRELTSGQRLARQRMDFLLLFSHHDRIVIEVDGAQHYSLNGIAKPELYAGMVAEDRRLRLAGYELYRFGGYELQGEAGKKTVVDFFNKLFQHHALQTRS